MIVKNRIKIKAKKKAFLSDTGISSLVPFLSVMMIILSIALVHPLYAQTLESTNLSNDPGRSTDPRISVSANNVYVVWSDATTGNGDIYFKASTNNGANFTGKKILSSKGDVGSSISPQIAASGKSNVYVVWSDTTTGNGDIYFRASADNGTKFSSKRNLTLRNAGNSISPQIAASGNNVYVVWSDNTPGNSDTFLKASTNNGANFSGNKFLSSDPGNSYDPKIAVSGKSNVYVVWEDNTVGQNNVSKSFYLYFKASTNAGASFSNKEPLNRNIGQLADYSQITASGDNAYVVWSDISRYQGLYEVFLRAITNNGTAISDPIKISNTNGSSISPQVAVSGDYIYVVWQDDIMGNSDIYFRRGVG